MHDYNINASTIRECNFNMRTIIWEKGFPQALVHTVHVLEQNPFPKLSYMYYAKAQKSLICLP